MREYRHRVGVRIGHGDLITIISRDTGKLLNFEGFFRQRRGDAGSHSHKSWGRRGTAGAAIASRLTIESVARRYHTHNALQGVDLDIAPGEVVCLLGPSGCGKTTLLRIAAGIEKPSSGRILLDGREVAGPNRFVPPEKRNVGLVFQDFALFPHLTILGNVMFGLRGLPQTDAERVARAALDRVGLAHYANGYPHTLSGGEQQRVALARAIAPRPGVLLMDEPFSGLDVQLRATMQEETLAILRETGATCIIVTHDSVEAMRLGDRIAVMRDGRVLQVGSAEDLYGRPHDLFVARMFSAINEVHAKVRDGAVSLSLGTFEVPGIEEGEPVVLGIRERGISLSGPGPGGNGRVRHVRFLGDAAIVEVAVDGLEDPIRARVRDGERFSPGDEVRVTVDPSKVVLFPVAA